MEVCTGKALDHWKYAEFPGGSAGKEFTCNAGDTGDAGLIPGSRRSLEEENGNPVQYSCLKNPMDRGAWWGQRLQRVAHDLVTEQQRNDTRPLL